MDICLEHPGPARMIRVVRHLSQVGDWNGLAAMNTSDYLFRRSLTTGDNTLTVVYYAAA